MNVPALTDGQWQRLLATRATEPTAVAEAYAARRRPGRILGDRGTLLLVAADHPARGALAIGGDHLAMADRRSLLARLVTVLGHPEVDGVLGTPDVVEELLLLGALEEKVVIGSMNRGGLDGATWTMDDRFTGYDAATIARCGLEGGKMLLRIDDADDGTVKTLEGCARAVTELAERELLAMVEPLPYRREADGSRHLRTDTASLARAVSVASGLGTTSAYTWLKMPACEEPDAVFAATTLPCVILGGAPGPDPGRDHASWGRSLAQPAVRGLVVGRALLYPPDGDVLAAVEAAVKVLAGGVVTLVRPQDGPVVVEISPADAGWERTGLRVLRLRAGDPVTVETGESELFVLPLSGSLTVRVGGDVFKLVGRESVFTRVTDFAYVGRDSSVTLVSDAGAEVALPSAVCERALPPRYGAAEDVPIEIRGAGVATRQVANFGVPGVWDHADRLICCELLTPAGNWSSYPPHKHDASDPCQVVNEEIYYYRIQGDAGFGFHTTYTGLEHLEAGLGRLDVNHRVRDHDVVLVPHGYHGPCVAAPDHEMYYLNVMAGPTGREMAWCDDPAHGWVRETWAETAADPRCPMTSAAGRREHR